MKRSFAALLLLFIPALMTCCWKTGEDWSLCGVDDNFILRFSSQDGDDMTFQNDIKSVNVFIFDADKHYLTHKQVDKSDLDEFCGITFSIPPGIYHVVCWANVDSNSRLSDMDMNCNYENSCLEIMKPSSGLAANGSPIYYAPYKTPTSRSGASEFTRTDNDYSLYEIEVSADNKTEKELFFAKVHRTVQVYIKGYENTELYDGKCPLVRQTNGSGKYDFLLRADPTPFDLEQATAFGETENGEMHIAEFFSPLIPIRNDMNIDVFHPTQGNVLVSVNLEQFIAANNISDDSVVPIQLTFDPLSASVSITMPKWLNNDVVPDL